LTKEQALETGRQMIGKKWDPGKKEFVGILTEDYLNSKEEHQAERGSPVG